VARRQREEFTRVILTKYFYPGKSLRMEQENFTAFRGDSRCVSGPLPEVALALKRGGSDNVLIFNDRTGAETDLDLRGTEAEVAARYAPPSSVPGRPKLGVVAKEVTLLPRHWDWLKTQRGGASATLRRLVEDAARGSRSVAKAAAEAAYRFMSAMAGNRENFEEAARALFAADGARFAELTENWPEDVRAHARQLAAPALID